VTHGAKTEIFLCLHIACFADKVLAAEFVLEIQKNVFPLCEKKKSKIGKFFFTTFLKKNFQESSKKNFIFFLYLVFFFISKTAKRKERKFLTKFSRS
jgi:hypothetical protein